ncbi:MAG TPA: GNAT family N-acetyltransferase [Myxococcota bacterium]|nr:GNAT family N-acetyltransferase [Myxococcota bacterium]
MSVLELGRLEAPSVIEIAEDSARAEAISRVANGVTDPWHQRFHDWLWRHYSEHGRAFVAVKDGVDAGALVVLARDGVVRYRDVCTLPDQRSEGVCTALVGTVAAMLEGRQVIVAARDTTPDRIYRRLGFEQVSTVVEIGVPR